MTEGGDRVERHCEEHGQRDLGGVGSWFVLEPQNWAEQNRDNAEVGSANNREALEAVDDDPDIGPEHGHEDTRMVQLLPGNLDHSTVTEESVEQGAGEHASLEQEEWKSGGKIANKSSENTKIMKNDYPELSIV